MDNRPEGVTMLEIKFQERIALTVKPYLSIFRMKAAEGLQYRVAALAGASISIFWAAIEIITYSIFYHYADKSSSGMIANLSLQQIITYVWLAQVFFLMQPMNVDSEILQKIISGDVGIELCRPLNLYYYWFAKIAAGRFIPLLWRGSFVLMAGLLAPAEYKMIPPSSLLGFLCALLSLASAFLLCSAFGTLVSTIRLNITWGDGPTYIIMLVASVLSGTYIPLQLWPDFMQNLLLIQPFAGYLDIPLRLYLGTLAPENALWAVSLQLLWTLGFILVGKRILSAQLKKIVVQGG